ncbi:MAG TPA: dethiobiotin synthase [Gammaproteobacteria bacterium]|nr:dethiobiotin synthase [Gammaproteobacteria bacterium]
MTTIFVTASGTGVGKTFVAARLLVELRAAGFGTCALKPVATGFDETRLEDCDSGRLLLAQGEAATLAAVAAITPWRFAAPLSPDMAAAREGRAIPFEALLGFCRAPRGADVTLIEGIGGVMVPLDAEHTVLEWIAALGAPALLVAGSYLGTLSHTLTAARVLRERGCPIAGVVVSESSEQPVDAEETARVLARFVTAPVAVLPRTGRNPPPLLPLVTRYL